MEPVLSLQPLLGTWQHRAPWNGDDYLSEYVISAPQGRPEVVARDLSDGEAFVISDVSWDGSTLSFVSLMPSTGRLGVNRFKLAAPGAIESTFAFTVMGELVRVAP